LLITRTPFRIGFFGGGTDLPAYFTQETGRVLSATIFAHMYITVHRLSPLFPFKARVSYSQTELAYDVDEIKHPVVRECLKLLKIEEPIEITSIADIPGKTGLGSSSSFTVGLLHALHAYKGEIVSAEQLAEEACHIEIDVLNEPIGKQDQYAAAFGGLREYTFRGDGTVSAYPIPCNQETLSSLFGYLMLFYVGGTRNTRDILQEQSDKTISNLGTMTQMRDMCEQAVGILNNGCEHLTGFGQLLNRAWKHKRSLTSSVSSMEIDDLYDTALNAGAIGGKLLGAGGAGFLLLFVPREKQKRVREAFRGCIEQPVEFDPEGSRIIYVGSGEYR